MDSGGSFLIRSLLPLCRLAGDHLSRSEIVFMISVTIISYYSISTNFLREQPAFISGGLGLRAEFSEISVVS